MPPKGAQVTLVTCTLGDSVKIIPPSSGLGEVYGLSMSRFLADNDHPDQLVLSLYGMLAIGMTPGTFVSGESISVVPVRGAYVRSMYMPPNLGANASYLETLRQALVHERRGASAHPRGLDLAFSTPRAWLADGKEISVTDAPTSSARSRTRCRARARASISASCFRRTHAHGFGFASRPASGWRACRSAHTACRSQLLRPSTWRAARRGRAARCGYARPAAVTVVTGSPRWATRLGRSVCSQREMPCGSVETMTSWKSPSRSVSSIASIGS